MTGAEHAPTPAELAKFDQAWAEVNARLDRLINAHRGVLAESEAPDVDRAGLGIFVLKHTDHEAAAELVAAAIDRLVSLLFPAETSTEEEST